MPGIKTLFSVCLFSPFRDLMSVEQSLNVPFRAVGTQYRYCVPTARTNQQNFGATDIKSLRDTDFTPIMELNGQTLYRMSQG